VGFLRLFTPARYDGLPGWPFPAAGWSYPTARETADYLEAYAARFELPVRNGLSVDRVTKDGDRFVVECGERRFEAGHVVVATGFYGTPSVPGFADELDPRIVQMHSSEYRDPSQLRPGGVLLVGAGNSGADIAIEVSKTHRTWLSGRDKGQVPIRIESRLAPFVLPILWFVASHVLTVKTPIGRKAQPHVLANGAPRIRVKTDDLEAAGVDRVPKTVAVSDGLPVLEDERTQLGLKAVGEQGFGDGGRTDESEAGALQLPGNRRVPQRSPVIGQEFMREIAGRLRREHFQLRFEGGNQLGHRRLRVGQPPEHPDRALERGIGSAVPGKFVGDMLEGDALQPAGLAVVPERGDRSWLAGMGDALEHGGSKLG